LWPTIAVLVLLPLLIGLGVWQLDRARQKIELQDARLAREQATPVRLGEAPLVVSEDRFRRARGTGHYQARYGFLLDNQVHKGQAGYHVLTPFKPDLGTQWILVDRGWVAWGPDRDRLPDIATPGDTVTIEGRLVAPQKPSLVLGAQATEQTAQEFTRRWQSVDLQRFADVTGLQVAPLVLQLAPGAAHGFVREWPVITDEWINRHKAYALQWFALALTLVLLYLILNFKRDDSEFDSKQS